MPAQITYARLNIVSGEAFFEQFGTAAPTVPDAFWLPGGYGDIFRKLRGGPGYPGFAMPWRDGQRSTFWKAYCEQTPVNQISTELAARTMVPLRLVAADRPGVRITDGAERLFYDVNAFPHGLVVSLTIQTSAVLSLDEWRDRMRALQLEPCFALKLHGVAGEAGLRARDLLEQLVAWHRDRYFGPIAVTSQSEMSLAIATVIQGSGVDPSVSLASSPDLQKMLNAIAALPVNWPAATLPSLDDAILPASSINASPGDALYAARRGRILWRPALFTYPANASHRLHSLSCLAHNILAASVQAESLRLFAIRYAALSDAERDMIPPIVRNRAAILIGRMWRGDQTYRSASVKRQIKDSGSLAQVNALLTAEQVPPIGQVGAAA